MGLENGCWNTVEDGSNEVDKPCDYSLYENDTHIDELRDSENN